MKYTIIYDGNCNLCVSLVRVLERLDKGERFQYLPMQDRGILHRFGITPQDCEMGMLLIANSIPERRWQGSDAAEEIGRLLPGGNSLIAAYRSLPGLKWAGDLAYAQIRDNRYMLFGKRFGTYHSPYPIGCSGSSKCHN